MRRYVVNKAFTKLPSREFDVIVVGGGLAGLYTSLLIKPTLKVAVLVKKSLPEANSSLAQGGIAAAVKPEDSPEIHFSDTMRAGAGMSSPGAVKVLAENGPAEIARLASLGVCFDTDDHGEWLTTSEGAHQRPRILHCGGDATGKLMMEQLIQEVADRCNITLLQGHFLTDIVTDDLQNVTGVVSFQDGFQLFAASKVVIATGGVGGVYRYSTNLGLSTGDGIAAAARAGARLQNMEFVQFHPTAFFYPHGGDSMFLISEAVRGEGGVLRNHRGDAFMEGRHKFKNLAPRDFISREIFREMHESGQEHVYLDIRHHDKEFLSKRFPTIYNHLEKKGIQMDRDLIPVVPAQHYFMGGIKTNLSGQTSVKGLYACGEAACTGAHGANRLASNSLLECVVFGARVAEDINQSEIHQIAAPYNKQERYRRLSPDITDLKKSVQDMMQHQGGIARNPEGLVHAIDHLSRVKALCELSVLDKMEAVELLNMATVGREILLAALTRRESIGSHFLFDEPEKEPLGAWDKNLF